MTRLAVAYFREIIGYIDTDGPKNNWESANTPLARFLENKHPGELPNTFRFLQPEGWLAGVLEGKNYVEEGIRFLSNLTIMKEGALSLDKVGIDTLQARLKDSTDNDGTFTGVYHGPSSASFTRQFEDTLEKLWENDLMPKFSGAQVKMPVSLLPDGNGGQVILPAIRTTFSHILKLPREGFHASFPAVEWMGLEMSRRAGLETAEHALVEMPEGMPPALIVERFDIPDANDELRHLTRISDFCNITDLAPEIHKYGTDVAVCFAELDKQSSNPEEDKIKLFKRLVLGSCMLDDDLHLKNLSVLKTFDRETGQITVRFSPTYDAVTTAIYPEISSGESALNFDPQALDYDSGSKYGGTQLRSYKNYSDLMAIAKINGIPYGEADAIIEHIAQSVAETAVDIARNPPEILKNHPACLHALKCVATQIIWNTDAANPPEWGDDEVAVAEDYQEAVLPEPERASPTRAFNGTLPKLAM